METMATLGERISLADAKAMIAEVDSDGDKEINYEGTTRWRHALLCSSLLIDVTGSASICVWRRHA